MEKYCHCPGPTVNQLYCMTPSSCLLRKRMLFIIFLWCLIIETSVGEPQKVSFWIMPTKGGERDDEVGNLDLDGQCEEILHFQACFLECSRNSNY